MAKVKFAIPKGSLEEATFKILEKALVPKEINFQENRDFLKTLGFTWDEMAKKYLSLYQELNNV